MKITLVISSLSSGGAERVLTGMANHWERNGHDVTLITYSPSEDFYFINSGIKRIRLNLLVSSRNILHAIYNFFLRWLRLRRAIIDSTPNVVLSFMDKTNVLTLLATTGLNIRVVVAERTNPKNLSIKRIWSFLRDMSYRLADAVVVQTEILRSWAVERSKQESVWVIPNSLDKDRITAMHAAATRVSTDSRWAGRIMAMGRMTEEKGHDLLLTACSQVLPKFPNWRLELIGDGPLRIKLEAQAYELGISNQVFFHGQQTQPFSTIKTSDIFVLPSRLEGFPNALLEALALNRACISFNCPCGPSELIKNGVNGLLVPPEDVQELAKAIQQLIVDPELRAKYGEKAGLVTQQYSEDAVMKKWDEVMGL